MSEILRPRRRLTVGSRPIRKTGPNQRTDQSDPKHQRDSHQIARELLGAHRSEIPGLPISKSGGQSAAGGAGAKARAPLNKSGWSQLSTMPKNDPTAGPMKTQPIERASIIPTPVLPLMPTAGKAKRSPQPKQKPTRADGVRVAKAKIIRRNSLRKQRDALRG